MRECRARGSRLLPLEESTRPPVSAVWISRDSDFSPDERGQDFVCSIREHVNDVPMKNITSCAADGAANMMGKKNGCLKLMKDANPEMILVHCVIHRQNLVAKNISPILNEVLHTVLID
ncbi:SCAN domain-containing protein 3 [Trichonephila clavipes]|nr:SCAN domain-containing protein 3 [Trichonephila clavipes]